MLVFWSGLLEEHTDDLMFFSHASFRSQAVGKEEVNKSSVVSFFSLTSTYTALFSMLHHFVPRIDT